MPKRPLPEATVDRIRGLARAGVAAKEIARMVGVSEATVSKYRGRKGLTEKDRFEEKFTPEPNSGCWLWDGAMTTTGRPYAVASGYVMPASRAAWKIFRGDIPAGLCVLHNCHNKACVNPAHMRLGTHQDNVDDMFVAGRAPEMGDRQRALSVLGEKSSGALQREVAKKFDIQQSMVSRIWNGVRWSKLGGQHHA